MTPCAPSSASKISQVPAEKFLQTILDEFSCGHRKGGAPPSSMNKADDHARQIPDLCSRALESRKQVLGPSGQANWIEDLESASPFSWPVDKMTHRKSEVDS